MKTYGTHTTPIHRYVDDLTFTFIPNDSGCLVDVSIINLIKVSEISINIFFNQDFLKYFKSIYDSPQAYSESETLSLLDYGTNYCNLFNLMDGSGLALDPAFTEDTNDLICTQRSTADCDIY